MSLHLVEPSPDDGQQPVRDRIQAAENFRRPFELGWLNSLAMVAGQQWLVAPRGGNARTLSHIADVDPRYADRDLYTADVITEQRGAALGELQTDSDRPELLLPGDGDESPPDEDVQKQANRAVGHGWDYEWEGDSTLLDVRGKCADLGVAAVRCMFDPTLGQPVMGDDGTGKHVQVQAPVHHQTGQPITDASKAHEYVSQRVAQGAPPVAFKPFNEGRIQWKVGSAFNLLAPPGIPHEKDFPYEIWVGVAYLPTVKAMYGPAAANLSADADITSTLGLGIRQQTQTDGSTATDPNQTRLKDHVWFYTYFEKPTAQFPQGRVVEMASKTKTVLRVTPQLPYQTLGGDWHSGIVYFHWWRLNDRFYSRSLIEGMKDPQRMINRRKTQMVEIIDRGMPKLIAGEGTFVQKPTGVPMELVEVKNEPGSPPPVFHPGTGPGAWFYQDIEALREDLAHASTLSALKLGENPVNADTYSALALLQEQEQSKRSVIRSQHQAATARLVEFSLADIRQYWPDGKQLMVAGGEENELQLSSFQKSAMPTLYVVRPAKGTARPRGQAAQLQLVTDIWTGALASTAVGMNPLEWIEWLKASYEAGEPLELPQPPIDNQAETAERENHALLMGEQPAVAYWDNAAVHIPIHRQAEDEARVAGDTAALARIEQHVQEHQAVTAVTAAAIQAQAPPPPPPAEAAPGQPQGQPQAKPQTPPAQ